MTPQEREGAQITFVVSLLALAVLIPVLSLLAVSYGGWIVGTFYAIGATYLLAWVALSGWERIAWG